jgi:Protein of unknown function DUF86
VPSRHDLADILENLERIEGYVAGLDREAFGGDTLRRDAVERCLERICKAAFRLGEKRLSWRQASPGAIFAVWVTNCAMLTTVSTSISCGTPSENGCPA